MQFQWIAWNAIIDLDGFQREIVRGCVAAKEALLIIIARKLLSLDGQCDTTNGIKKKSRHELSFCFKLLEVFLALFESLLRQII